MQIFGATMSIENLMAFRQKVDSNPELQQRIRQIVESGYLSEIVNVGNKHGYEFSELEINEVFGPDRQKELSASQLKSVIGGVGTTPSLSQFETQMVTAGSTNPNLMKDCGAG